MWIYVTIIRSLSMRYFQVFTSDLCRARCRAQNCERLFAHATENRPGRIEIMTREPNGELRIGLSTTAVDLLACESVSGESMPWRL